MKIDKESGSEVDIQPIKKNKDKRESHKIIERGTTKECEFIRIKDNSQVTEIDSTINDIEETTAGRVGDKCK